MKKDVLLSIQGLCVTYRGSGREVPALNGVSFDVSAGEIVALVGESGSGKSTLGLSLLGILPESARTRGSLILGDRDIVRCSRRQLHEMRGGELAMVFQEPSAAFNPVYTVGFQMAEVFRCKLGMGNRNRSERTVSYYAAKPV